jgi:hypothetical protein
MGHELIQIKSEHERTKLKVAVGGRTEKHAGMVPATVDLLDSSLVCINDIEQAISKSFDK